MFHWLADVYLPSINGTTYADSGVGKLPFVLYHFLRLLGWDLLAECDNHVSAWNHVSDGSMEAANTTSWTALGSAAVAKSTVQRHCGSQSLTFTTAASGDGVQSAVFSATFGASAAYRLCFWLWNNCGHALTVYVDTGTGSWTSLGTVAANGGVWTRHEFGFTTHSSVASAKFKLVDEAGTVAAGEVYLDTVYVSRSYWEQNKYAEASDGVIEAGNNTFSSASYAFTDDDVTNGRYVVLADTTNVGNSGAYKVVSRDGDKAVLELRHTGTYYLTAATGLSFRVIDPDDAPQGDGSAGSPACGAGFLIQSPHSSHWRLKYRQRWYWTGMYNTYRPDERWVTSPEACEYDINSFQFLKSGRSTARNGNTPSGDSAFTKPPDAHNFVCSEVQTAYSRCHVVTDGETFITIAIRNPGGYDTAAFFGFLGDNELDFDDTFAHLQYYTGTQAFTLMFTNGTNAWTYYGNTFDTISGLTVVSSVASGGIGSSTASTENLTNAKANPWSGLESVRPLMLFCDRDGARSNFGVIEATLEAVGMCRSNIAAWTTFGTSREWLHTRSGFCIAWNGRQELS